MKNLLVFDYVGFLKQCQKSPDGSRQRETMAEKIAPYLDGGSATIISSNYEITNGVADAIEQVMNIDFESCPIIYKVDGEEDFTSILQELEAEDVETVLLATTKDSIRYFKEYFTGRSLKTRLWKQTLEKGGVLVLNYTDKTVRLIEPDPIKPRK